MKIDTIKELVKRCIPSAARKPMTILWRKYFRDHYMLRRNIYKNKILFIHIPKTAGSAISKALFNSETVIHKKVQDYKDYHKYEILYVVRNPFERIVSLYYYWHKTDSSSHNTEQYREIQKEIKKCNDFREFIANVDDFKFRSLSSFDNQYSFVADANGQVVGRPIYYENLDEGYEELRKRHRLKTLRKVNTSLHKVGRKWQGMYDARTAKKVYQMYEIDFRTWYPNAYRDLKRHLASKDA